MPLVSPRYFGLSSQVGELALPTVGIGGLSTVFSRAILVFSGGFSEIPRALVAKLVCGIVLGSVLGDGGWSVTDSCSNAVSDETKPVERVLGDGGPASIGVRNAFSQEPTRGSAGDGPEGGVMTWARSSFISAT